MFFTRKHSRFLEISKMPALRLLLLLIGVLHFSDEILADSDLQSALDAIDRRQRELAEFEEAQQYGFNFYEQPEELSFLNNVAGIQHILLTLQ